MTQQGSRRLAAVWFADIVGYTELSALDEDLALRVVRELQRIARMQCDARGGRVVKLLGDAILTVFDSADGALRAAIGVRDGFLQSPEVRAAGVSLRIGLHLGDVAEALDGDIYGDAVNAASRIEGAAGPGQVVMGSGTYQLLQQRATLEVEDLGEHELKGLGLVRLYAASLSGETESADLKELLQAELAPLQMLDVAGFGGMGEIYLARDPRLHRTLAVKVLRSELVADKQARSRFVREAQVIAGLSHPNIIGIHSVGELKDGTPYFVMDYVEGGSLADRLETDGPLPLREATRAVGQVASALEAAHAKGVVHRDIKASNILHDVESGRVLVTDWGIAALDPTVEMSPESRLTQTGMVIGSPRYMSPEQLAGDEVGPETDVYALGLLAFELITGDGPYKGATPRELMVSQLRDDAPRLSSVAEDVADELDALVGRCLAKTPENRPTAREITQRLGVGGEAVLEWPPPGLHDLKRLSARAVLHLGGASVLTALAYAANGATWAFSSREVASMLFVAIALGFAGLFVGLWALFLIALTARELRHGAGLHYGWGTILDVVADRRGDSGHLLAGIAEYAGLAEEKRLKLLSRRRLGLTLVVAAAIAPIPSLVLLAAFLRGEGSGNAGLLLLAATLPTVALLGLEFLSRATEARVFREPRRRSRHRKGPVEHLPFLVEAWREGLGVVLRTHERATGLTHRDRAMAAAMVVLLASALAGSLLLAPIFTGGMIGAGRAAVFGGIDDLQEAQQSFDRARLVQGWALPPDSTIDVEEASTLAWSLLAADAPGGVSQLEALELPAWLEDIDDDDAPIRFPTTADTLIQMARHGLTEDQLAWVDRTRGLPAFEAFTRVARAPALDVFGARYPPPVPDSIHWLTYREAGPFSYPAISLLGRWKILRSAAALSRGEAQLAERELREILSFGFLLMDQPLALENRIGALEVERATGALMTLYELQGRTSEVLPVAGGLAALGERGRAELGNVGDRDPIEWVNGLVRGDDPTLAPSARFETLHQFALFRPCIGVGAVLFGPGQDWHEAMERARSAMRPLPGDREYFRMAEESSQRYLRSREPQQLLLLMALGRISGWLLQNERIPACVLLTSRRAF